MLLACNGLTPVRQYIHTPVLNRCYCGRCCCCFVACATGSASFNKGSLGTSVLKHPLTQLTGSLAVDGDTLAVSGLEAKVGPKGALAIRGTLPLTHLATNSSGGSKTAAGGSGGVGVAAPVADRLHASVSGVELRVRNVYSGSLDADLDLRGSLSTPVLGGKIVFSRGTAFLVPPAGSSSAPEATATPASSSNSSSSQAELVRTAFAALKAGKARAATAAAADARGEVRAALDPSQCVVGLQGCLGCWAVGAHIGCCGYMQACAVAFQLQHGDYSRLCLNAVDAFVQSPQSNWCSNSFCVAAAQICRAPPSCPCCFQVSS